MSCEFIDCDLMFTIFSKSLLIHKLLVGFEMDMNKDATITYDGTNTKGKQDKGARLNEAPIHSTDNSQVMS